MPERASRPVNVLFVLGESSDQMFGQGHGMRLILRHLKNRRPCAVVFRRSALSAALEQQGVPVDVLSADNALLDFRRRSPAEKLRLVCSAGWTALRLFPLLLRRRVSAIYVGDAWSFWVTLPAARLVRSKVTLAIRDQVPPRWHWRWAFRLADRVIVLSHEMRESVLATLSSGDGHADKTAVIYNPVDIDAIDRFCAATSPADARCRLAIPADSFVVGLVGALSPKKGQREFIGSVLPRLLAQAPGCIFYFIGGLRHESDRAYLEDCQRAVRELGLQGQARLVGYQPEMFPWYRALDLLVLASQREGLPRAMIEALAFGLPVVSTPVLSAREVLERHACGRVVPLSDPETFAAAILGFLHDANLRRTVGETARRTARALFQAPQIAAAYEEVLQ